MGIFTEDLLLIGWSYLLLRLDFLGVLYPILPFSQFLRYDRSNLYVFTVDFRFYQCAMIRNCLYLLIIGETTRDKIGFMWLVFFAFYSNYSFAQKIYLRLLNFFLVILRSVCDFILAGAFGWSCPKALMNVEYIWVGPRCFFFFF